MEKKQNHKRIHKNRILKAEKKLAKRYSLISVKVIRVFNNKNLASLEELLMFKGRFSRLFKSIFHYT